MLCELLLIDSNEEILPAIRIRERVTAYRQILLPTLQPVRFQMKIAAARIRGNIMSWRIAMPSQ
jgi:hypothetical protein